jgi:hypothetical protein
MWANLQIFWADLTPFSLKVPSEDPLLNGYFGQMYALGMLTPRGRPAPLASRLHRIPTHFRLNLHGI